ncbi:MAG: hypothetical protein ACTSRC_13410 [Candidatus Helarchaeota archaeon]
MSASPVQFGYPRALYDPCYVPPTLFHRDKEMRSLLYLFHSSLNHEDQFNLNTYIYGIHGVGKTVFTKYFIKTLKSNYNAKFTSIYLNLGIKSPFENLQLLVELYSQAISGEFIFLQNPERLWSYFHFLRRKAEFPLILILDNVDYLNLQFLEKIVQHSKDLNLSLISISHIPFERCRQKNKRFADQFDPFKLNLYSSSALLDIISQRIALAFPIELDRVISKYIVDIVANFDLYRPSTCISILKTIYQHMIEGNDINPALIRDSSYHLLEFPFQDDLDCLLEFDDAPIDLIYLPLLEKLANFFKNWQNVYISRKKLFSLYKITCDELNLPYHKDQFQKYLENLIFYGFLYPSQFQSAGDENIFFIIIDPNRILDYIDIKFPKPSS